MPYLTAAKCEAARCLKRRPGGPWLRAFPRGHRCKLRTSRRTAAHGPHCPATACQVTLSPRAGSMHTPQCLRRFGARDVRTTRQRMRRAGLGERGRRRPSETGARAAMGSDMRRDTDQSVHAERGAAHSPSHVWKREIRKVGCMPARFAVNKKPLRTDMTLIVNTRQGHNLQIDAYPGVAVLTEQSCAFKRPFHKQVPGICLWRSRYAGGSNGAKARSRQQSPPKRSHENGRQFRPSREVRVCTAIREPPQCIKEPIILAIAVVNMSWPR